MEWGLPEAITAGAADIGEALRWVARADMVGVGGVTKTVVDTEEEVTAGRRHQATMIAEGMVGRRGTTIGVALHREDTMIGADLRLSWRGSEIAGAAMAEIAIGRGAGRGAAVLTTTGGGEGTETAGLCCVWWA